MGGDSKTTSTSMDPTYAVASTYTTLLGSAMSQELWNMTKPYYQEQLQFASENEAPYYKDLYADAQSLLPQQTALSGAQLNESLADIQRNVPVKDALTKEQLNELEWSSPVREALYKQALKGVDPDYQQVMGQATAGVEQQYANSEGALARQLAKTGLSADSGAYASALSGLEYNKVKDKAFARSQAYMTEKNNVDTENWNRLAQGVSAAGRATGLAGVSDSSQANSASKNLASSSSTNPYSDSAASQGSGTALQGIGNAASNFTALGNGNSTKETSGGNSGWGSALGTGAGLIGSAILNNPTVAAAI